MKPKKFLFISYVGLHTDLAWQVVKEGHEVKYYIDDKEEREVGDGFIPKTNNWKAEVDWADVIVFDDVLGHGTMADNLRKKGKAVVGGTPYTDRLEDDRSFGQSELKAAGVNVLPYKDFTDFDEAIAYVLENPSAYVIKPCGEAANTKHLLFVGMEDDGSDVIGILQTYKKAWSDTIKVFQLQKKATGVEVAIGAFFNGNRFVGPVNINFEHKKLFPGNIGPSTGEMGTSMFWSKPNKLFNSTLKKFEGKLREEKFVGYIDVNTIVNSSGIFPLEFTSRFGYPTIQIQVDSISTPIGQFLYDLATGADVDFKAKKGFSLGIRIVVPPFPFEDRKTYEKFSEDVAIVFKKKDQLDGVHIEGVHIKNGVWSITGVDGCVLIITGLGATMKQAQIQAYYRVQNVVIPNMYYRGDIGDNWHEDSDKLLGWGYLSES